MQSQKHLATYANFLNQAKELDKTYKLYVDCLRDRVEHGTRIKAQLSVTRKTGASVYIPGDTLYDLHMLFADTYEWVKELLELQQMKFKKLTKEAYWYEPDAKFSLSVFPSYYDISELAAYDPLNFSFETQVHEWIKQVDPSIGG